MPKGEVDEMLQYIQTRGDWMDNNIESLLSDISASYQDCPSSPTALFASTMEQLRITEIMYNPDDGAPESVELLNLGHSVLDIRSLRFAEGIFFSFTAQQNFFSMASGERIVLPSHAESFQRVYQSNSTAV